MDKVKTTVLPWCRTVMARVVEPPLAMQRLAVGSLQTIVRRKRGEKKKEQVQAFSEYPALAVTDAKRVDVYNMYFWFAVFGFGVGDAVRNSLKNSRDRMMSTARESLQKLEDLQRCVSEDHLAYNMAISQSLGRMWRLSFETLQILDMKSVAQLRKCYDELSELQHHRLQSVPSCSSVVRKVQLSQQELVKLDRLMLFSAAAYGHETLRFLGMSRPEAKCDVSAVHALTGCCEQSQLLRETKSRLFRPGHYVCVDHKERNVIVAIRGTMRLQDLLTDLICDGAPFRIETSQVKLEGTVHEGFLRAAQTLAVELYEPVKQALHNFPGYSLVCTGHSYGGSVASLLALVWAQVPVFRDRDVRGYAFGAPCSMSSELALAKDTRDRVTSVVLGDDFISRLSAASVEGLFHSWNVVNGKDPLTRAEKQARIEELRYKTISRTDRMYPGGLTYRIPELNRTDVDCENVLSAEEVDPVECFREIILGPKIMSVHLPNRYLNAIRMQQFLLDGQRPHTRVL